MPLIPWGKWEAATDKSMATVTRTVNSEFRAALEELLEQVAAAIIAGDDTLQQAVEALVGAALEGDPRLPKLIVGNGWAAALADSAKRIAWGVRENGDVVIPVMNGMRIIQNDEWAFAVADRFALVAFGIRHTGEIFAPSLQSSGGISGNSRTPEPAYSTKRAVWDPALSAYNLHPRSLLRTLAKIAKGTAHIAALGDSRTRGALATGTSNPKWKTAWPGQVATRIGAAGTGVVPFFDESFGHPSTDPRWSWGAGVTSKTTYGGARGAWGPQGCACAELDNSGGAGWIEFDSVVPVNEFWLWLVSANGNSGLATVKVDGSTVGTVSMAATASGGTLTRETGYAANQIVVRVPVSAGVHTVRVEGASGEVTNLVAVEGRGAGNRVSNLGRSATKLADWVLDTGDGRGGMPWHIDAARADLLVVMPVSNDRQAGASSVASWMRAVITRQRETGGEVLVILPSAPDFGTLGGTREAWDAICGAIYALADELDFPLIDNSWGWIDWETGDGLGLFGDGIHENDEGSSRIADTLIAVLQQLAPNLGKGA